MKKLLLLTLILCLVLPCFGCNQEDPPPNDTVFAAAVPDGVVVEFDAYRIDCVDNRFYINFADGNEPEESEINYAILGSKFFSSPLQLKNAFLNGEIDESIARWIKIVFPRNEHGIIIGNLQRLYVPQLPNGWETGICYFSSRDVAISFGSKDENAKIAGKGRFTWLTGDGDLSGSIASHHKAFEDAMQSNTVETHDDDTDRETLRYSNAEGKFQMVRYEFQWGAKCIRVFEEYCFESTDPNARVGGEIPIEVNIFVSESGHDYQIQLWNLNAALSKEDVRSFVLIQLLEG